MIASAFLRPVEQISRRPSGCHFLLCALYDWQVQGTGGYANGLKITYCPDLSEQHTIVQELQARHC